MLVPVSCTCALRTFLRTSVPTVEPPYQPSNLRTNRRTSVPTLAPPNPRTSEPLPGSVACYWRCVLMCHGPLAESET